MQHRLASLFVLVLGIAGCGDDSTDGQSSSTTGGGCELATATFPTGDENGHADPLGAKAANQARAGRIKANAIPKPAHGRQAQADGDFLLINDKVAVVIEDKGVSDGYSRFGGDILSIDRVGDDGKPLGLSTFNETLGGFSLFLVEPTSVTVMNDGSDGKAAVIRATGPLKATPFLADSFGALFPTLYEGLEAAVDYELEPGAGKLKVKLGLINNTDLDIDLGVERPGSDEFLGFFQGSHNQLVTSEFGFDKPTGEVKFVGFDGGISSFAYQGAPDNPISFGGIEISGFSLFTGSGFIVESCSQVMLDRHEIIPGGPHYDGLRESVRAANGEPAWREITGVLRDDAGLPVGAANVHLLSKAGAYLSRTVTEADGAYVIHAPDEAVDLVPQKRGYPVRAGIEVGAAESTKDLVFDPSAKIHVVATEAGTMNHPPVRIQVIPVDEPAPVTPPSYGFEDEARDRLHQEFAAKGDATLDVPPGTFRVIVSRGWEWELSDTTVTVAEGELLEHPVEIVHSVDTTGVMCADFHIHSAQSADSSDPIEYKLRSAIADGLDIPVSSEHEWVVDFQPVVEAVGAADWAFGLPAEELTTFKWGHFGVVPLLPKPGQLNNGAMEWLGKDPKEVFAAVKALPEKPVLIVHHPRNGTFQGYFSEARLNPDTGIGEAPLWDDGFDVIEVFNDSDFESNKSESVRDWFGLLNAGKTVFAVGSSDSHRARTSPVGYPRTCLAVGTDDPKALSQNLVRDTLGAGHATIGGGIYMSVVGQNGEQPGDIVGKRPTVTFTVTVEGPGWLGMSNPTLETYVNGEQVKTEALLPSGAGPSKLFTNQVAVTFDMSKPRNWVVFHARADGDLSPVNPGKNIFAVSNPVLFEN